MLVQSASARLLTSPRRLKEALQRSTRRCGRGRGIEASHEALAACARAWLPAVLPNRRRPARELCPACHTHVWIHTDARLITPLSLHARRPRPQDYDYERTSVRARGREGEGCARNTSVQSSLLAPKTHRRQASACTCAHTPPPARAPQGGANAGPSGKAIGALTAKAIGAVGAKGALQGQASTKASYSYNRRGRGGRLPNKMLTPMPSLAAGP
jgi:hypothetical protein